MSKRRKRDGPWLIEWKKNVGKVKLIGARLGVPTYSTKTSEDFRYERRTIKSSTK